MAYIGRGIDNISQIEVLDIITFTNSAGPYNILKSSVAFLPSTPQSLLIEVDGIIQAPASYTITGSTITFGVSMSSSSTMNSILHFGTGIITTPADLSVTTAKIASDAVTTAKILDNNVTVAKLPTTLDISGNTVTLPASVSGLGTGITNAQLAGSIADAKITALSSSKLSGVVPTANLGSGSASSSTYLAGDQTYKALSEYNDDALQNDIATLALHQATNANAAKYNLANTNVDVYQDSTGISALTDCVRDTSGEYVSTISTSVGEFTSDSDTQLLLHMDGPNSSTTITDSSSNASAFSAIGHAGLDTGQKKFGTASLYLDGSGDRVDSAASLFDAGFGTGNFTIEGWFRPANVGAGHEHIISKGGEGRLTSNYEGWTFNLGTSGVWSFGYRPLVGGSQTILVSTAALTQVNGTWYHWAITRQSNTFYIYIDGVNRTSTGGSASNSITTDNAIDLKIGASGDNGGYTTGMLDEMRISTVNRYPDGTTFTPNEITTVNATGNYVSTATVANASVSKVGIVMTYKNNAGTNTLNTDIIAQVSADGGSNYSTVTLAAAGTFSTGVLQAVANDVSVTPGTNIQYKISFANQASGSKEARITGASLIY
jgi:hypothetical protein